MHGIMALLNNNWVREFGRLNVRNLGLIVTFWLSTLILPTNSLALGLGEIEVTSFLNQPLDAEIEVISARAGEIDDLLVSLASREAFTRAGLSRSRNLTELRFSVRKNEAGDKAVILVTTKSSIKEPFLNFLIEADWSKGRLLREFTILLDPPFYADAPVEDTASSSVEELTLTSEPAAQPVSSVANDESIANPIATSEGSSSDSIIVSDESDVVDRAAVSEGDTQVFKGDTLWSIASRYKDSAHSMAQVMLAIQRSNPDAFGNGNINNLKVGAVLRAPGADEIDALSQQEAYARVLEQNGLWDDYVARVTGVSPSIGSDSQQTGSADSTQEGGELSLLVPGDGDSKSSGTGDSKELNELRTKLAIAEEELDATRVENSELESRVSELQARLSKVEELQKMVQIEDDSLAQMQSQQVEDEKVSAESVSEEMQAEEAVLIEELLAEEAAAQALEESLQPAVDTGGESEDTVVGTNEVIITETIDENGNVVVIEGDMVDEVVDSVPPTPVIITDSSARSPSMFDGILPASVIAMIPSFDIGS
ncbi:MAG: pilus assembly protein FimV, partial [Gammaproteobacteria bacterium]